MNIRYLFRLPVLPIQLGNKMSLLMHLGFGDELFKYLLRGGLPLPVDFWQLGDVCLAPKR